MLPDNCWFLGTTGWDRRHAIHFGNRHGLTKRGNLWNNELGEEANYVLKFWDADTPLVPGTPCEFIKCIDFYNLYQSAGAFVAISPATVAIISQRLNTADGQSGSPIFVPNPVNAFGFPTKVRIKYSLRPGRTAVAADWDYPEDHEYFLRIIAYNEAGQIIGASPNGVHLSSGESVELVYPAFNWKGVDHYFDLGGILFEGVGIDKIFDIELLLNGNPNADLGRVVLLGPAEFDYTVALYADGTGMDAIHEHRVAHIPIIVHLHITEAEVI